MRDVLIAIVGGILGAPPVLCGCRRSCADWAAAKQTARRHCWSVILPHIPFETLPECVSHKIRMLYWTHYCIDCIVFFCYRQHCAQRKPLIFIEQFNTPVGRITYNIVQIKSKREKNQLQAWTIKTCRMSTTTSLYNLNTDRTSSLAWESVRKHQKILHNNGLADNIIYL